MIENIKKILHNKNNELTIIAIVISFLILIFKQLISTYISSVITLIPTIIIFVWFLVMFFKGKISIKKYDMFFVLMLLIGTLSGLINKQNIIAIIYQIKSISIYYLLFMIVRNVKITQDQTKQLIKFLNIITVIIISFSIIEIISQKTILFPKQWSLEIVFADNYIRAYSLICNPNLYAFYLLFVMVYNYRFNKQKSINIIFYSLLFIGIILSVSRSALICLIIVILTYLIKLWCDKNNRQIFISFFKKLLLIIIIAISVVILVYKVNDLYKLCINKNIIVEHSESPEKPIGNIIKENPNLNTTETFLNRIAVMSHNKFLLDSLNNGRMAIINYGIKIWQNNVLIGTGFSSFLTASNFINPNEDAKKLGLLYADNQYIALLVETGVLGVTSCLICFIIFLKELIVKKKFESIIITFIFLFFGFFINVLEVQLIAFLYFLFISLDKEYINDRS